MLAGLEAGRAAAREREAARACRYPAAAETDEKVMSQDTAPRATYDAVIILGSNIRQAGDGYRPVTYEDYDQFGMLAGEIKVIAAVVLCEHDVTDTFVFSTGTSEKTRAAFGSGVPTEAAVYSQDFLSRIGSSNRPDPTIILEDRSVHVQQPYGVYRNHPHKSVDTCGHYVCAIPHATRASALGTSSEEASGYRWHRFSGCGGCYYKIPARHIRGYNQSGVQFTTRTDTSQERGTRASRYEERQVHYSRVPSPRKLGSNAQRVAKRPSLARAGSAR